MNWDCLDYLPHYQIGNFIGEPLYLPRCASNYFGHNINSTTLIWRSDKHNAPAIISIRHCIYAYLILVNKSSYSDIPRIHPSTATDWVETSVNYELQHHLFEMFKQKQATMTEDEKDFNFDDWCKCSIGEFLIKNFPTLLTDEEKYCLNKKEASFELNQVELTHLEESEIKEVNLLKL